MSDNHEYVWKSFSGLFQPSRVSINFTDRLIEFHNAIRPNSFFNLFFQKFVRCPFSDVTEVDAYTQNEIRCLEVKTKYGNCVYLGDSIPRFDDFVADFYSVVEQE